MLRQLPLGLQGGDRQLSCKAGTHTSYMSHTDDALLLKQFLRPHQTFEHFARPPTQIHELQLLSSITYSVSLSVFSGLYGDNEVVFRQTEVGSDSTKFEIG